MRRSRRRADELRRRKSHADALLQQKQVNALKLRRRAYVPKRLKRALKRLHLLSQMG